MRHFIALISLSILLFSCGEESKEPKVELKEKIAAQEKKVSKLSEDYKNAEKADSAKAELSNVLAEYYKKYPKDEYAATCLSKLHMLHSESNAEVSIAYADTLIDKFPNFVDRAQMIESQIINYEMVIHPRDKEMIKKYLNLWLKENKDAPKEKIEEMKYHLDHIDQPLIERFKLDKQELD